LRILEVDRAGHIGGFSAQLGQVENAPGHHQINRQAGFDAVGCTQLPLLDPATTFQPTFRASLRAFPGNFPRPT
jgi:hypothetical protein